jgi:hypothetical protein
MPEPLPPKNTMCQHYSWSKTEKDLGRMIFYTKVCNLCGSVFETWFEEKKGS